MIIILHKRFPDSGFMKTSEDSLSLALVEVSRGHLFHGGARDQSRELRVSADGKS